jgi:hypothetical protein
MERIRPGISRDVALADLVALSERAHYVRDMDSGTRLFRGPRPSRLRCIVGPQREGGALPDLVTVLRGHDRC